MKTVKIVRPALLPPSVLLLGALGGCAASVPAGVTLPHPTARAVAHVDRIYDYPTAAASIAAVLERTLGIPPFPVTFHFVSGERAFEAALVEFGQDPLMARDTASVMRAVGMYGRVLLNNDSLQRISWRNRVRVLAHELIHSLQYELAGGRRGTSEQWLREGFAEWAALSVLDDLRGRPLEDLRAQQQALFRRSDRSRAPRLDQMLTFEQWVPLADRPELATYAQAFLTVDFLVSRHGVPAVVDYFRQFATTADREAAFRRAFGEDRDTFGAAADAHLGIRRRQRPAGGLQEIRRSGGRWLETEPHQTPDRTRASRSLDLL